MMNITAKPTWQWASKCSPSLSPRSSASNSAGAVIKQALMPRSLDLVISLKYRR